MDSITVLALVLALVFGIITLIGVIVAFKRTESENSELKEQKKN